MGTHFQLRKMKKVKMDVSGGCTTMWIYLMPLNCTRKMINVIIYVFYYNKKDMELKTYTIWDALEILTNMWNY